MQYRTLKSALYVSTTLAFGLAFPAVALGQEVEEVVVTARRVEERLQDVPISMTVFNQKQLDAHNIVSGSDLAAYTPSLSADNRFGRENATFAIRGFTQELRTTASVGVYFADVVAPRGGSALTASGDGAGPGAYFDLQNVQVLKGPQGTLFGRNTTGGAVLLVPKKPTSEFGGYIEGGLGDYDMKRIQGVLNVPMGSKARMRLGFDRQTREGYEKNFSNVGPSRFADVDYYAGRASLVVDVTPDVENYTIFTYSHSDTAGTIPHALGCNAAANQFFGPLVAGFGLCPPMLARQAGGGFYAVQNAVANPESFIEQWQAINTTTWQASDSLTIKNILSFSEFKQRQRGPFYGENFFVPSFFGPPLAGRSFTATDINPPPGYNLNDQSTLTEELQFQGHSRDRKFTWQAGGYMELSDPQHPVSSLSSNFISCTDPLNQQCIDVAGLATGPTIDPVLFAAGVPIGGQQRTITSMSYRNLGVYAQGTYSLTEKLKLTAGIRYTADKTEANSQQITYSFFTLNPAPPPVYFPSGAQATCLDPAANPATANDPVNGCRLHFMKTSDRPTWHLDLKYDITPDANVYVSYGRGYRQGGIVAAAPAGYSGYGPESVDTYEVGAKTTFHGKVSGTFNVAAFYNDFSNQQLQVGTFILGVPGASPSTTIQSSGQSRIFGAEIESSLYLFEGFKLDLSGSYLDTKLEKLAPPPASPFNILLVPTAVVGTALPNTPRYKITATGTYRLPLAETMGDVLIGATYSYTGKILEAPNTPFGYIDATNLVNLNLSWNSIAGSPVDAALFVTNLLDDTYYTAIRGSWDTIGIENGPPGEPRMFGARLRLRFGADARG